MMALRPSAEGQIKIQVPTIDRDCFTYYKIFGDISSDKPRVIIIHGGPGAGHEYLLSFAQLSQHGMPCIFYDQIGCGKSTHLPETRLNETIWQESLFISELRALIEHLELDKGPGFHIIGQSWGGMLAASFAATKPAGLRRLVLASALASKALAVEGTRLLRRQLPAAAQQAFEQGEASGETNSAEYKVALDLFYKTYLCRTQPYPPELMSSFKTLMEDRTVNETMQVKLRWNSYTSSDSCRNGTSAMNDTGSNRAWTVVPRLTHIEVPTLVYNGEFDTSHDVATDPFFELIPHVRWITFANGGHMCHLEEGLREKVLNVTVNFLK